MARREITNWSQLQRFQPREIFTPRSEDELAAIVARAGVEGRRIKVMGAGHSFTAIAVTPDFHVTIHALDQLHHVDQSSGVVTVGAGITLKKLNRELDRYGLALTNMGDIDKQSIAGAVSTGTHGTGLAYGGIATQIRGLRMITPNGDVVDIDANHEPELFRCARVGLGALGIITRVTLQAVPSFRLHAVESSHSLDDVLEAWPDTIRVNDHAEFFFMPGGRNAARKINNRTDEPAAPLSRRRYIADKLVAENVGFGVINRVARRLPRAAPTVAKLLNGSEMNRDYVDVSHKVFSTPRWVHFYESEWSVPLDSLVPAIRDQRARPNAGQARHLPDRSSLRCGRRHSLVDRQRKRPRLHRRPCLLGNPVRRVLQRAVVDRSGIRRPTALGKDARRDRRDTRPALSRMGSLPVCTPSRRP